MSNVLSALCTSKLSCRSRELGGKEMGNLRFSEHVQSRETEVK